MLLRLENLSGAYLKEQFKDKKVCITGGAGFIGSNLALELIKLGAKVTVLDAMLPMYGANNSNLAEIADKITVIKTAMDDKTQLVKWLAGADFIFNLAGLTSHADSIKDPSLDLELNTVSQLNLMEACRELETRAIIVFTSTRSIYGETGPGPVTEECPVNPPDINAIHTYAAEQYHQIYSRLFSLRTVILRLTNTYGPRQQIKNSRQGFMGWFLNRGLLAERIKLFGGGDQFRDFTYVDDVVQAMLLATTLENLKGDIYNLGGFKHSLKEIAHEIADRCPGCSFEEIPFPADLKRIDIGNFEGNYDKFKNATGWRPTVDIAEGLDRTIAFYKDKMPEYIEQSS